MEIYNSILKQKLSLMFYKIDHRQLIFWSLSILIISILHAFQWTLPLQIDSIGYLAHAGIYSSFPNLNGFDTFLKDLLYIFQIPKIVGGWEIKSFLLQYFARIFQHITTVPSEILFSFSIICTTIYITSVNKLLKNKYLTLSESIFVLLLLLAPSLMVTTRGGWQQANANSFVLVLLIVALGHLNNFKKGLALSLFSVFAYLTHAEAIYAITSMALLLWINNKMQFKQVLIMVLPVFILALLSMITKSPTATTDIQPTLFLHNPLYEFNRTWQGIRENLGYFGVWIVLLIASFILKQKKIVIGLIIATLPWCAQLVLHFAKNEAKHYLAIIPPLITILALNPDKKPYRPYTFASITISVFFAGLGIHISYNSSLHDFYGQHAHGRYLFSQNNIKKTIKEKHIQKLYILDDKVSEMYSALTYAYQIRRSFQFIPSHTELKMNDVLITSREINIPADSGLKLIASDTQICIWQKIH